MLTLLELTKSYGFGDQRTAVLQRTTLDLVDGSFCALTGPSGSGKSTLLNIMGLLDRPTTGRLLLNGHDITNLGNAGRAEFRNKQIGFVFQSFHLLPHLKAWENVSLPLLYRGTDRGERQSLARLAMKRVGLADLWERSPGTMSGGQRQRVAIARAIVAEPRLLLADEPTGSLDSRTASDIMDLFAELNRSLGMTSVIVTHDQSVARRCKRTIHLLDGKVISDDETDLVDAQQ